MFMKSSSASTGPFMLANKKRELHTKCSKVFTKKKFVQKKNSVVLLIRGIFLSLILDCFKILTGISNFYIFVPSEWVKALGSPTDNIKY